MLLGLQWLIISIFINQDMSIINKLTSKIFSFYCIYPFLIILLIGCSNDSDLDITQTNIVGTWEVGGQATHKIVGYSDFKNVYFQFFNDHSFKRVIIDSDNKINVTKGVWNLENYSLTLNINKLNTPNFKVEFNHHNSFNLTYDLIPEIFFVRIIDSYLEKVLNSYGSTNPDNDLNDESYDEVNNANFPDYIKLLAKSKSNVKSILGKEPVNGNKNDVLVYEINENDVECLAVWYELIDYEVFEQAIVVENYLSLDLTRDSVIKRLNKLYSFVELNSAGNYEYYGSYLNVKSKIIYVPGTHEIVYEILYPGWKAEYSIGGFR